MSVNGLTGATLPTAPVVCHECIFWQSRGDKSVEKSRWIERAESEWGAWGTVYRDADGRLLGSMQYGPAAFFPRAAELPAGPPAFAYRYPEGESSYERFRVHRTVFPIDFLADFGFRSVRRSGLVELARLDFGGLQPVIEGRREKVLRVVKEAFAPAPAPARLP